MKGGDKGLRLLCSAYRSLGLDRDYRGVGRRCFRSSCVPLGAVPGDVSLLIALEAESALDPLSFFFVRKSGARSSSPYFHSVGIAVVERIPPLGLRCSSPSLVPPNPFLEEDVFLLMFLC